MWQQVEVALSQSAHRVLVKLASFLPGLVALLLAVIVLTAIGVGLAALLRRTLTAAKFDERLARNAVAPISDWSPANSPTALIARFLERSVLIGSVNAKLQYARILSLGIKWLVLVLTAAMVLDHLQIGGAVVELAFGILFGGIVLTLALAVGLGSRDIVSRSLERSADHRSPLDPIPGDPDYKSSTTSEPLRHF